MIRSKDTNKNITELGLARRDRKNASGVPVYSMFSNKQLLKI
jgi:hypothetical protein